MPNKIRKFLVVVDDTTECHRALSYASQRAVRTNGKLSLLRVINTSDYKNLYGVEKIMKQEAEEQALSILKELSARVHNETGLISEIIIKFGEPSIEIINFIQEEKSISLLVLAASSESGKPGPLVSQFTGSKVGNFPIPITIVPGHLSEKTILALT
jgi:nucleotide-binding universal stress UspA family protein|tara:strand:- start:930 stop:1400 length:471 start_codon:yes stop_codon:yes gene_type:complete